MRFYLDMNGDGVVQVDTDYLLGEAVAIPTDGNNQFPEGYFEFTVPINLFDEDFGLTARCAADRVCYGRGPGRQCEFG